MRLTALDDVGLEGGDVGGQTWAPGFAGADGALIADAAGAGHPDPGGLGGRQAGALACGLGERRVGVDEATDIEHPDDGQQEDRQDQGELDEALAVLAVRARLADDGCRAITCSLTVMFEVQSTVEPASSVWRWIFLVSVAFVSVPVKPAWSRQTVGGEPMLFQYV